MPFRRASLNRGCAVAVLHCIFKIFFIFNLPYAFKSGHRSSGKLKNKQAGCMVRLRNTTYLKEKSLGAYLGFILGANANKVLLKSGLTTCEWRDWWKVMQTKSNIQMFSFLLNLKWGKISTFHIQKIFISCNCQYFQIVLLQNCQFFWFRIVKLSEFTKYPCDVLRVSLDRQIPF